MLNRHKTGTPIELTNCSIDLQTPHNEGAKILVTQKDQKEDRVTAPKNGMRAIHPGEILKKDFLDPLELPVCIFAKHICVSAVFVHNLLEGSRDVDVRMAFRLSRALGTTVEFWLNLQNSFNIRTLEVNNPGFADHIKPINKETQDA